MKMLILTIALCAGGAQAATVSLDFDVTASGFFTSAGAGAPPLDPVTGRFTLSFDNGADIQRSTSLTVRGLNIAYAGTIGYSYSQQYDGLSIGIDTTPDSYTTNNRQFGFFVDNVSTQPTSLYNFFDYSDSASTYSASAVTITNRAASAPATAAPEPASWALLLAGTAIAGAGLRRRRSGLRTV